MRRNARWSLVAVLLAIVTSGCLAAAAGAGAATGIYFTSGGAKALVNGSVGQVATKTESVLAGAQIETKKTTVERNGAVREYQGVSADRDVAVHLERQTDSTTNVEVTVKKNVAEYDKDYAKELLQKIVQNP